MFNAEYSIPGLHDCKNIDVVNYEPVATVQAYILL